MHISDGWFEKKGIKLHFLLSQPPSKTNRIPIVFLPGSIGNAKQFLPFMQAMQTRPTAALDLRGRGKSSAPKKGYTFRDHVDDLHFLLNAIPFDEYCLSAHSMSVPIAINCVFVKEGRLKSLVLGDYPPVYPALDETWAKARVRDYAHFATEHVIRAIQSESAEVDCWSELEAINRPVLYQVAGRDSKYLKVDDVSRLSRLGTHIEIGIREDSDHRLWLPDPEAYVREIEYFADRSS